MCARRASELLTMGAALTIGTASSAGQLTKLAEAATNSAHARAAILPQEFSITHGRLFTTPARSSASASTISVMLLRLK